MRPDVMQDFCDESLRGIRMAKAKFYFALKREREIAPKHASRAHNRVSVSLFPPPPLLLTLSSTFFQEEKMLGILVHHRVWSGVPSNVGMEVDRLPFHTTHAQVIQRLVDVTQCV